jgi:hypothetical protein
MTASGKGRGGGGEEEGCGEDGGWKGALTRFRQSHAAQPIGRVMGSPSPASV